MIVKDPRGRYLLGIIESPPLAIRDDEGTGIWILDRDGKMYFGHQLPPPEVGFGIMKGMTEAPLPLLEAAAEMISSMYEALEAGFEAGESDEAFHRLPEILMAGMGLGDDEAHDHAEALLEEADRLDECPWKLAAMHMAGVAWGSTEPPAGEPTVRPEGKVISFPEGPPASALEEKPEGKLIPFPIHRARPPAGDSAK